MKKRLLFLSFLAVSIYASFAQLTDDMESYTDGTMIFQGHWTDWNGTGANALYASSAHFNNGLLAGYIPPNNTTDALLDLGNKQTGQWGLKFMMYIPSGREAYLNIQSNVPVAGGYFAVGNIFFNKDNANSGSGHVDYLVNSPTNWSYFNFPHDEWFEVVFNIHINNNWQMLINGEIAFDWTEYGRFVADGQFEYANDLGGINFYSYSSNCEYWIDDINFKSGFFQPTNTLDESMLNSNLYLYPNPASDRIFVHTPTNLENRNIKIYSVLGNIVEIKKIDLQQSIDISTLKRGVYFLELEEVGLKQKIIIE